MRSALACLGISIGIAAVVAMMEIGQGCSYAIQQTIATLGANVVQIDPSDAVKAGVSSGSKGKTTLTTGDCEAILRECDTVCWAAPSVDCRVQIVYANRNWAPGRALGTTAEVPLAIEQITDLLRERHRLREDEPDDFRIRNLTELSDNIASSSRLMTTLLFYVSLISLTVGGVGIMNVMLVSVTQRTREIGLRMAVGARACDILGQFLTEAVLLCLVGGIAGIVLGHGASVAATAFLRWPTITSLATGVVAVAVCTFVGLLFGFYPAWKASRLDPIVALRYE